MATPLAYPVARGENEMIAFLNSWIELKKKDDDVYAWAKRQDGLFLPLDDPIQTAVKEVLSTHPRLVAQGKGRNAADPFVVALAMTHNLTVITLEQRGSATNPKIPEVCDDYGVPWVNLLEFIRNEKWRF